MGSLTEDGSDELDADLRELIAAGLVAVTGTWPDLRYVVTPEGEQALGEHERGTWPNAVTWRTR